MLPTQSMGCIVTDTGPMTCGRRGGPNEITQHGSRVCAARDGRADPGIKGDPLHRLIARLEELGYRGRGANWQCPAHDDEHPSLSIAPADETTVSCCSHCHAGCRTETILAALAWTWADLFPPEKQNRVRGPATGRRAARARIQSGATTARAGRARALAGHGTRRLDRGHALRRRGTAPAAVRPAPSGWRAQTDAVQCSVRRRPDGLAETGIRTPIRRSGHSSRRTRLTAGPTCNRVVGNSAGPPSMRRRYGFSLPKTSASPRTVPVEAAEG